MRARGAPPGARAMGSQISITSTVCAVSRTSVRKGLPSRWLQSASISSTQLWPAGPQMVGFSLPSRIALRLWPLRMWSTFTTTALPFTWGLPSLKALTTSLTHSFLPSEEAKSTSTVGAGSRGDASGTFFAGGSLALAAAPGFFARRSGGAVVFTGSSSV